MAEQEHKSLDDFFAKRDKKKKKDKGRGAKAPPVKAAAAAAPPQPPPPPPPPPTPPVAEPEALPAQPAPASAPQHDQLQAQAEAPAPDAEQGQAQAQAQGAEQGPQLNPPPPADVTTAPAPAPAPGGVRKPRKDRERMAKGENQDPMQERPREDEEWKEFEQKEVDYSGLRLHALQISDEREEEDEKKEDQDEDGENVSYREGDRTIGPWNKTPVQAPVAVVEEVPEVKPSGVYRPPGARLNNARRTQSQGPPEIFNDLQFPSLQASAKHVETRKSGWPTVDDEDGSREHYAAPEVEYQ
ncbi:protein CDV3 homolog isoform X2 [Amblyraja radiata]|uniref:protein CDV3 homolog isoform X2 n=1 Tax=Amblyraja radiata TaxID=386614 RepID=UPI0014035851|nr:protein CDV3 homolog isoform X2 [Amblyraja radiata]